MSAIKITEALNAVKKELDGEKIIGAYEYDEYFGFEIAPKEWNGKDSLEDAEIFVNKKTGKVEYLSPGKFLKFFKSGRKVEL